MLLIRIIIIIKPLGVYVGGGIQKGSFGVVVIYNAPLALNY